MPATINHPLQQDDSDIVIMPLIDGNNPTIDEFFPTYISSASIQTPESRASSLLKKFKASSMAQIRKSLEAERTPKSYGRLETTILPTINEFGIGMSFGVATYLFFVNPKWYSNPISMSLMMSILNFATRVVVVPTENETGTLVFRKIFRGARGLAFGALDSYTRLTLMHEAAHAITAMLVYINPRPSITIQWKGTELVGLTHYNKNSLSKFGLWLGGADQAEGLVSAAGTAAQMFNNYISLVAAQLVSNSHPEVASHLRMTVLVNMFSIMGYAFMGCIPGDDFCDLEKVESFLTPAMGSLIMLSSLLFLQLVMTGITCMWPEAERTPSNDDSIPYAEIVDDEESLLLAHSDDDTQIDSFRRMEI